MPWSPSYVVTPESDVECGNGVRPEAFGVLWPREVTDTVTRVSTGANGGSGVLIDVPAHANNQL